MVAVSFGQKSCSSVTNLVHSKYFPCTDTTKDQSETQDAKTDQEKEQAVIEEKTEDAQEKQNDDKMLDQYKSELEVEAEDPIKSVEKGQSKSEENGQELADLPDVPTTEPGEHGLPEAKKLKLDDDSKI